MIQSMSKLLLTKMSKNKEFQISARYTTVNLEWALHTVTVKEWLEFCKENDVDPMSYEDFEDFITEHEADTWEIVNYLDSTFEGLDDSDAKKFFDAVNEELTK